MSWQTVFVALILDTILPYLGGITSTGTTSRPVFSSQQALFRQLISQYTFGKDRYYICVFEFVLFFVFLI